MNYLYIYVAIGLWTYICVASARLETFKYTGVMPIIKGLLFGIILWPIAPIICIYVRQWND